MSQNVDENEEYEVNEQKDRETHKIALLGNLDQISVVNENGNESAAAGGGSSSVGGGCNSSSSNIRLVNSLVSSNRSADTETATTSVSLLVNSRLNSGSFIPKIYSNLKLQPYTSIFSLKDLIMKRK
jgi:hypothetical protein